MTVSAEAYVAAVREAIDRVAGSQRAAVAEAAGLIVDGLNNGGVLQAFGSGHSEALAMELAGRAGGLVPTNRLSLRDLVVFGGESPDAIRDNKLERDPTVAQRVLDLVPVQPADVFVIASNSGVNGSVVELATLVKGRGHRLIAITSLDHTRQVPSRHPSGRKLVDLADVVLDNGGPYGDALLDVPGGGKACAISSITGALLGQMIVAEVVRTLTDAGVPAPIYLSANVPGGDEHNQSLEARYAGRIRRTA